jgi:hypothetical protein
LTQRDVLEWDIKLFHSDGLPMSLVELAPPEVVSGNGVLLLELNESVKVRGKTFPVSVRAASVTVCIC